MVLVVGILGAIMQSMVAIGRCSWEPLRCQISYIKNLEKDFGKLKEKMIDLKKILEDVETEINRDIILKKPSNRCQIWLQRAREMENKVHAIEEELRENKRCCIGGLCPDIWWRRKLCKKIVKMIDDIVNLNLKAHSMFSGTYMVDVPQQSVERIPTPTVKGNTPIDCTVQKILRCLRDDDNKQKIGIWGMGGVGKTTTMKALNNSPEISSMFEMVIWVTVSKEGDIRKVQKDILERLSLNFNDNESVERTAMKIFQRLSNMKNYLLLLDDLWRKMDLEDVGIPNPSRENGCKLIITTRSMVVCNNMEIDEAIKVEVLSEEEAWNLFHEKVGKAVDSHDIKEIATQVVRECQGLPLAIIVIGGALRNKNKLSEWRNALKELSLNKYEIIADMEKSVLKILKFSYDQLERDNIKKCFLYCALYPEDYVIDVARLIQYWLAEGFIDGGLSLDEACDKGEAILNYLKDVSLLEGIDSWGVKMHDVIRDLALTITSSSSESLFSGTMVVPEDGNQFLVKTNIKELSSSNDLEDWGQFQRISLTHSEIGNLPENPTSLLLETLFLQRNYNLRIIPESFFQHMHNLRVLDLSNTHISELPSSVSKLVNLRGLFLVGCPSLITLPSEIGNLTKLQLLHVGDRYHDIGKFESLPSEIRQLMLLRSLRVAFNKIPISGNQQLMMIPNGIISSLSLLENLTITVYCDISPDLAKTVTEEVGSLKELTELEFHFHFQTLESIEWLEKLSKLKRCDVRGCNMMEVIFSGNDHSPNFPTLEYLTVRYMPRIRAIWEGPMPPGSFSRLASLVIFQCGNLRKIFTRGILQQLSNLGNLWVCQCDTVQVIVNEEEEEEEGHNDDVALFPKLKILSLQDLPRLERIWKTVSFPMAPSLETIVVKRCPNLMSLPYLSLGIQQN